MLSYCIISAFVCWCSCTNQNCHVGTDAQQFPTALALAACGLSLPRRCNQRPSDRVGAVVSGQRQPSRRPLPALDVRQRLARCPAGSGRRCFAGCRLHSLHTTASLPLPFQLPGLCPLPLCRATPPRRAFFVTAAYGA